MVTLHGSGIAHFSNGFQNQSASYTDNEAGGTREVKLWRKWEVTASSCSGKQQRKTKKKLNAAVKEISVDAALVAVLAELDFHIKRKS